MRFNKLMRILIIICVLTISIEVVSASEVNTTEVVGVHESNADVDYVGLEDTSKDLLKEGDVKTFTELQDLIDSHYNSVLNLTDDYTFSDGELYVTIKDAITINGNGHTISGNNKNLIFFVPASNVTINNLSFVDGYTSKGSALFWTGNNGILSDSSIHNNVASSGGTIYWHGINGTVINCDIYDNIADYGAAIYADNTNFTLSGSRCYGNKGEGTYGLGAVYITGSDCKIINNTKIYNNSAKNGGGVFWQGASGLITDSYFADNTASSGGGAVYWQAPDGNIINCEFNNNSANWAGALAAAGENLTVSHCDFYDNIASGSSGMGGAIYWNQNNGKVLNNSNFYNNSAKQGGAIYWNYQNGLIKDTIFNNNTATNYFGSALKLPRNNMVMDNITVANSNKTYVIDWGGSNSNLTNSRITNNGGSSAIIWMSGSNNYIHNTTFDKNNNSALFISGQNNTIDNSTFDSNTASNGGAVYIIGNYNKLVNSTVKNTKTREGAVFIDGNNNRVSTGNIISDCTFENNNASSKGGSVNIASLGYNVTVKNSDFTGDSAETGGSIHVDSNNATLINITISNSTCPPVYSNVSGVSSKGGGIYLNGNNLTLQNINISDSSAVLGGAVYLEVENENISIKDSVFSNNHAFRNGGSIYSRSDNVTMDNIKVLNSTSVDGGGIYSLGSDSTLKDSYVSKCNASLNYGGIFWASKNSNIINTTVRDCNADIEGGGICCNATNITVKDSKIIHNSADVGGGVIGFSNEVTIDNCIIAYNSADFGGGAFWSAGNGTLENSIIANNSATYEGGGVAHYSNALTEINNVFYNNTPDGDEIVPVLYIANHLYYGILFNMSNGAYAFCINRSAMAPDDNSIYFRVNDGEIEDSLGNPIWEKLKVYFWTNYFDLPYDPDNLDPYLEFDKGLQRLLIDSREFPDTPSLPDTRAIKILDNGTIVVMNFTLAFPASEGYQPLLMFTFEYVFNPDIEIRKITNNKSVKVGEKTSFTIIVKNIGMATLGDVTVEEFIPDGLVYSSYEGENWTKNGNKFTYNNLLQINETQSFTIIFDTIKKGNFTNVVVVSYDLSNETKSANNTTVVKNPNLTVEKISLTPNVKVGEIASFEIRLTNTGDYDLGDIKVYENFDKALKYYKFKGANWSKKGNVFTYNGVLHSGQSVSFIIYFNTTKKGTFINTVVVTSNMTNSTSAHNTTKVVENKTKDKNESNDTKKEKSIKINIIRPTGNPISILLIILVLLNSVFIKRIK